MPLYWSFLLFGVRLADPGDHATKKMEQNGAMSSAGLADSMRE
jgi:hypothetical protein